MTALMTAGALTASQSLGRVVARSETTGRSDVRLRSQESAFPSEGVGKPRPIHLAGGVRHPACGACWTGGRAAHCARCHLTTTSLRAFDAHQRITGGILQCLPPDKAGLVPTVRRWGLLWTLPVQDTAPWIATIGSDAS